MNIITALTALMLFFALCPWNCCPREESSQEFPHNTVQEHYIVTPDAIIYPQADEFDSNN